jgi:hypothetical protein
LFFYQSDDKHAEARAVVQIAKKFQELRGAEEDPLAKEQEPMQEKVGRRKTIQNLHRSHFIRKKQAARSLDIAFKRRFSRITEEGKKDTTLCVVLLTRINGDKVDTTLSEAYNNSRLLKYRN